LGADAKSGGNAFEKGVVVVNGSAVATRNIPDNFILVLAVTLAFEGMFLEVVTHER
jgi:ABC-type xylose transport system permease subunit